MSSPSPTAHTFSHCRYLPALLLVLLALSFTSCTKVTKGEEPRPKPELPKPVVTSIPTWLGNPARDFYGTGPWQEGVLTVGWEFKTSSISGRLHKDPWAGTSWPGQPSVDSERVYFP